MKSLNKDQRKFFIKRCEIIANAKKAAINDEQTKRLNKVMYPRERFIADWEKSNNRILDMIKKRLDAEMAQSKKSHYRSAELSVTIMPYFNDCYTRASYKDIDEFGDSLSKYLQKLFEDTGKQLNSINDWAAAQERKIDEDLNKLRDMAMFADMPEQLTKLIAEFQAGDLPDGTFEDLIKEVSDENA